MHLAKYGSHQTTQTFEIVCCITWELANPPSVVPDLEREHRSRVHCNKSIKGLFMRRRVTQISTLTVVQERTIIGLYRNRSTGRSIRFSMGAPVSSTRIDSLLKISLFCPPFTLFLVSEISIDNFASDRFDLSQPEVAQPTWTLLLFALLALLVGHQLSLNIEKQTLLPSFHLNNRVTSLWVGSKSEHRQSSLKLGRIRRLWKQTQLEDGIARIGSGSIKVFYWNTIAPQNLESIKGFMKSLLGGRGPVVAMLISKIWGAMVKTPTSGIHQDFRFDQKPFSMDTYIFW